MSYSCTRSKIAKMLKLVLLFRRYSDQSSAECNQDTRYSNILLWNLLKVYKENNFFTSYFSSVLLWAAVCLAASCKKKNSFNFTLVCSRWRLEILAIYFRTVCNLIIVEKEKNWTERKQMPFCTAFKTQSASFSLWLANAKLFLLLDKTVVSRCLF